MNEHQALLVNNVAEQIRQCIAYEQAVKAALLVELEATNVEIERLTQHLALLSE